MIRKEFEELKDSGQLPSPSGVGLRILCLTQEDNWAIDELVGAIQTDPALTGRILRLANSSRSGSREAIGTVQDASLRLGIRSVTNLALGFTLVAGNRSGRCPAFDYEAYWSDSLARAVSAEALSRALHRSIPTEAFTCALLSRVGELALASVHPTAYSEILQQYARSPRQSLRALETERFAIDSREVSLAMIADWGLPDSFFEAIGHFELPDGETSVKSTKGQELMSVLRLARTIASFCTCNPKKQVDLWPAMETVRYELNMNAADFSRFCKALGKSWAEWGRTLQVVTTTLPSLEHIERISVHARARETTSGAETDEADVFRPLRILAVDDEAISLRLLESALKKVGHEVVTAKNGKEALALTLEWNPHIVISDWMMPEMDGIGLCKALRRAQLSGRAVYFLLLTGRGEEDRVVEAFESGIDDYVVKPFNPKILLARVRAGLRLVNLREQVEKEQRIQSEATSKLGVMARKLSNAASTDPLTGIPNRRYGMQRLQEEWEMWKRKGQNLALVMADVDHFKKVNDTYGHDVGDLVLRQIAEVMRRTVRSMDTVARIGGEEFLVVCPDTDIDGAVDCAERIRKAIEEHSVDTAHFTGGVTLSVGVAAIHRGLHSVDELLKLADSAVYRAKDAGRNRVCRDGGPPILSKSA